VLANFADRVVPSESDESQQVTRYSSVVSAVHKRLSRWPAEGLAAYRAKYDVEAQSLLDSAQSNDPAMLNRVLSGYFLTEAARSAGVRLIDTQLESGEFAAAAWTAQRMLDLQPDLGSLRPMLLYRAGLAYHLGGDDKLAGALLAELEKSSADAIGHLHGQDVRLVDALKADLNSPRVAPVTSLQPAIPGRCRLAVRMRRECGRRVIGRCQTLLNRHRLRGGRLAKCRSG